ncbi:MAG: diaminopimelate epimerase [Nitrospiraceae bacterium]|nr:diaminopimelate epimerase [Nitrospiraceae bacterium]
MTRLLPFTKMQGTGNDFVLLDGVSYDMTGLALPTLSKRICDRRFGIGADQLLLLGLSRSADFSMRIFNADGSEVQMCGNGIRCLASYIWKHKLSGKETLDIETKAGIIRPSLAKGQAGTAALVRVNMGEPVLDAKRIPVNLEGRVVDYPLSINGQSFGITCVSMGNPHAVIFVADAGAFPVRQYGPLIENHPLFPERTNVEFVQVLDRGRIRMRVWERGSGETLACGTGASASAVAAILKGLTDAKVAVMLEGGILQIEWDGSVVYMTGPAEEVFEGEIYI